MAASRRTLRATFCEQVGYHHVRQLGADLLFQVVSHRYDRGSIAITTNNSFKCWPEILGQDATLAAALLDRHLHADVSVIQGLSYRAKERLLLGQRLDQLGELLGQDALAADTRSETTCTECPRMYSGLVLLFET